MNTLPLPPGILARIEQERAGSGVPGCSVAVIGKDGTTWGSAHGLADAATRAEVRPQTAFRLYSGTKLYTATAIVQLADAGKIDLDGGADAILPDVLKGLSVSIRQLLNHTSGLADTLAGFLAVHEEGAPAPTAMEALNRYRIKQKQAPGTSVAYRNVNYALLGEIVSRVSGMPYEDYVATHILKPLGSGAGFAAQLPMATGYMGAFDPMRWMIPFLLPDLHGRLFAGRSGGVVALRHFALDTAAAGGLVGPAAEFLPFLHAQLNAGGAILSPARTREMQTLSAQGAAGFMAREGVGLGWKIGRIDGVPFLNHEGGGPGFTSETRLYPTDGIGVVVMMNRWSMSRTYHLAAHRICETVRKELSDAAPPARRS